MTLNHYYNTTTKEQYYKSLTKHFDNESIYLYKQFFIAKIFTIKWLYCHVSLYHHNHYNIIIITKDLTEDFNNRNDLYNTSHLMENDLHLRSFESFICTYIFIYVNTWFSSPIITYKIQKFSQRKLKSHLILWKQSKFDPRSEYI